MIQHRVARAVSDSLRPRPAQWKKANCKRPTEAAKRLQIARAFRIVAYCVLPVGEFKVEAAWGPAVLASGRSLNGRRTQATHGIEFAGDLSKRPGRRWTKKKKGRRCQCQYA